MEPYYQAISQFTNSQKENIIKKPLVEMYGARLKKGETPKEEPNMFSDITVDVLRERITTFNNLIVRLPVSSKHNCLASKHIFQDWKAFVDGAVEYLLEEGELTSFEKQGIGSDMKKYTFNEYLTKDGKPLVDYSWLYDTTKTDGAMHPYVDKDKTEYSEGCNKEPIGDRFDYWRDGTLPPEEGEETPRDDFKWPQ